MAIWYIYFILLGYRFTRLKIFGHKDYINSFDICSANKNFSDFSLVEAWHIIDETLFG